MQRFLIALLLCLGLVTAASEVQAQFLVQVSGYLPAGRTRVFASRVPGNTQLDTIYQISGTYSVAGRLVVQEGAEVQFLPNSRIMDSTGGKIIANGFTGLNRRIVFRGQHVNQNSVEWGHFLILPGADSAFFANVHFIDFKKSNTVDKALIYGTSPTQAANSIAITSLSNGVGGVLTTFSQRTWIWDAIVDGSQALYRGGSFAFLQAPSQSYFPGDDGRLALERTQVGRLTIRDSKLRNDVTTAAGTEDIVNTLGGAIYMSARPGASTANYIVARLGNNASPFYTADLDEIIIERAMAENTKSTAGNVAKGGAIYVGNYTGLIGSRLRLSTNEARAARGDQYAWGGAIAVSATSGHPAALPSPAPGFDRLPGLTIYKTSTFTGNIAGLGGALQADFSSTGTRGPVFNIDAENIITVATPTPHPVRDSGQVSFIGNVAYLEGGAIFNPWFTYITGYLAPREGVLGQPDFRQVEGRVLFNNNVAGQAGGSIYTGPSDFLDNNNTGRGDIQSRRVLHIRNSVNPTDPRINRNFATMGLVRGGGAEYITLGADSTFAVEYNNNHVIGGNGGAVYLSSRSNIPAFPFNRYFAEDKYNAQDVRTSPLPYDPRELTRFVNNHVYLGPDSATLVNRTPGHPEYGRGGALYIYMSDRTNPMLANDSTFLNRVRMEQNYAFTGSAIHADLWDFRIMANQSLIANNHATSGFSANVDLTNLLGGPADVRTGATIYGEFNGTAPSFESNSRGNAIYDNTARYIIRLPDGPLGSGGVDTVRGNFWGDTGPDLITTLPSGALQRTFFLDYYREGCFTNVYEPNRFPPSGYTPVPVGQLPDTILMEGRIYDIYDKGTDIKTMDYNNRRMSPSEAFSLGIPTDVQRIHRFTRDIFSTDQTYLDRIMSMQTDFIGPHPIGFPLFLQADIDPNDVNRDEFARNYSVLMVINTTTNEFVRVNAKETVQDAKSVASHLYQGRLDFVPDSSTATRNAAARAKVLWTLSLLRPSTLTFDEIQRASKLEDSAALDGRRYDLGATQFTPNGTDAVCIEGISGTTTWYAGERYHTMPVRPGDNILVISRTQLWKYGAAGAIARGLQFTIGDVLPPQFTSDIVTLQNDPINPNRRFLREDENYDSRDPNHILFRVAGFDPNNFYDPRFQFDPSRFTQLNIATTIDPEAYADADPSVLSGVRLDNWLKMDTLYNQNVSGSNGYVLLSGQPHNPDVVPGGEGVTVTLTNFPPNFESQSGLINDIDLSLLGANKDRLSMWAFPPYFNCPTGFLSDTLCVRSTSTTYKFRIFVQDSLPRFTSSPTVACAANLTDMLRYSYDVQTDDESEDSVAQTEGWDFRYGRTSYNLLVGPEWLRYAFRDGATSNLFTSAGRFEIRIPRDQVIPMITPTPQINQELNLDTIISIQADDGHSGLSVQKWRIPVNVEPQILTESLPNAKEDFDYSFDFRDTTKVNRIRIFDPNFADFHTFRLLYAGETDTIYRDNQYKVPFNGTDSIFVGTTPLWLQIDPVSGVLYGTPGAQDAPRAAGICGDSAKVMVVVTDNCGLSAIQEFRLQVDSLNHAPTLVRGPRTICVTNNERFCDSVTLTDRDLLRTCDDAKETLTLTSLNPEITVTPATITGPMSDTTMIALCGTITRDETYFANEPLEPIYIGVVVRDAYGAVDTVRYLIHLGDKPTFRCAITVSNLGTATHPEDQQILCFGAGRFGTDSLDVRYCEFELPPPGPTPVFDSRWELPVGGSLKGTDIDIRRDTNQYENIAWQVRIQAGNEAGSFLFPVRICWKPSCVDQANTGNVKGNFYLRHPQIAPFSINMRTGEGNIDNNAYTLIRMNNDSMCLEIRDVSLENAFIVFQPSLSDVDAGPAPREFALEANSPNPFIPSMHNATIMNFEVKERSNVTIEVYDMKGQLINTLVNEVLPEGSYPATWNGTDMNGNEMPSGTYIAKMTAGAFTSSIKMTLAK
jgi:predicted outer membrane repeat protein